MRDIRVGAQLKNLSAFHLDKVDLSDMVTK